MPRKFIVHDAAYPHLITSTTVYWLGIFCRDDYFRILYDSFVYCCNNRDLMVHAYVFMTSHFHAICSAESLDLPDIVRDLKKFTSKAITRKLEEDNRTMWLNAVRKASAREGGATVWQAEYHPVQLHTQEVYEQRVNYIHNNPVRAGYVEDAVHWKYSSAGFYYLEQPEKLPITPVEW